jgi:putative transposase
MIKHREVEGKIKTMTIKRDRTNKFYASFVAEYEPKIINKGNKERLGIDLGLNSLLATSNGRLIDNPRFLRKSEEKLKRKQRVLSRRQKGSRNRKKSRYKVARLHEKIANQRRDFMHKLTTELTNTYGFFAVEDLETKDMLQNQTFSKSISDASWGIFLKLLSCKAESANLRVTRVTPRDTSKTCSNCGSIKEMPLSERTYNCSRCGTSIDRDINAAKNILKIAATMGHMGSNACGDGIKEIPPMNQELISVKTEGSLGL